MQTEISRALWDDYEARQNYLEFWDRTGVTLGCVATVNASPDGSVGYPDAVSAIANQVYGPIHASEGKIRSAVRASDIEAAHRDNAHAMMVKFDNSSPIGHDLDRVDMFYNLGLRSMQLTYNLRNLAGDGCTERNPAGLSRFGMALVERLNERGVLVDVSHASEPTALDAAAVSKSPIWMSHGAANSVFVHDRNTTDRVIKAIADGGGYVGVGVVAGFLQGSLEATLDDVADHLEHFANVAGVDHVGIGTDIGDVYTPPQDNRMLTDPAIFARHYPPGFAWHGFAQQHRTFVTKVTDYETSADWPSITVHLAKRGFNEEELRKLLGLNFLRLFAEVVG